MHAALLPKIQKLLHDWLLYVCCTCCRHTLAQCWCLWIPIRITTFTMTSMYRSTEMSTSTSSHLICKYHHIFCITCNKRKGSVLFTFGNSKFVFLNWCLLQLPMALTLFWQFYFVNFELLLYFFSIMHCTLNWISKIINDSAEECLYQLYQIIMNPLFLQNKELSDHWTRKKHNFLFLKVAPQ